MVNYWSITEQFGLICELKVDGVKKWTFIVKVACISWSEEKEGGVIRGGGSSDTFA